MFIVYSLVDPRTQAPFYIGYSNNSVKRNRNRPKDHINEAKRKSKKPIKYINPLKTNVIKKILSLGLEPIIEILFEFDNKKQALDKEKELIAKYGRRNIGTGILTNLTDGGECASETLLKSWEERYGREIASEKKLQASLKSKGENNGMYGKKHSEASKKLIADNHNHNYPTITESHREAIRLSNSTRTVSEKVKQRVREFMRELGKSQKGKKMSKETKAKLSLTKTGKPNDANVYHWYHEQYGERQCTRLQLQAEFPELRSEALGRVVSKFYIHHKGWKIKTIEHTGLRKDNTSGVTGVSWHKRRKKWIASFNYKKKIYRFGGFFELEDAIAAHQNGVKKILNNEKS